MVNRPILSATLNFNRATTSIQRPFFYRDCAADSGVIKQIFHNGDYDLSCFQRHGDIMDYYQQSIAQGKTPLIIDCGANIGASVLFFSFYFPQAFIIAIEPDTENLTLLEKNCQGLAVKCIHGAVAAESGQGVLIDPGQGEWGYRLGANNETGNSVKVFAIQDIVDSVSHQHYHPFLIKIDIEGGEKELFAKNTQWFDDFYLAIIECHDWLLPKSGSAQPFLRTIAELNRDFVYKGENIFSIKND